MLLRSEGSEFAAVAARSDFEAAHLLQQFLTARGQLAVALGRKKQLDRTLVDPFADVPARTVTPVMLHVERLIAFRSGSQLGKLLFGIGVSEIVARGLTVGKRRLGSL